MKRILFLIVLLVFSIPAFCQTGNPSGISDLLGAFATIGGMVSLTLLFTGWIKTTLEFTGNWARWLSWAVAMLLSFIGWLFNLGIFEPVTWGVALIYGLGIGLIANGVFTSEIVQNILALFKAQVLKE
jgi:hypothetical protein